jgi:hypothetical protein
MAGEEGERKKLRPAGGGGRGHDDDDDGIGIGLPSRAELLERRDGFIVVQDSLSLSLSFSQQ